MAIPAGSDDNSCISNREQHGGHAALDFLESCAYEQAGILQGILPMKLPKQTAIMTKGGVTSGWRADRHGNAGAGKSKRYI